jgi:ATP phosphoribosyltransferase regulatory subunit
MRDLLPEETRERRHLAHRVLERLELHGYGLVLLPAFEFADVLERGLGALDPSEVLRFVEPESGEVAAFRPDMTPQIARMIATRLASRPPPFRLAYEGTVLRRLSGRARKRRQIPQVGVELAGVAGIAGDLEVLELAMSVLEAAGLKDFVIDLGDAGIVRALLADVSPEHAVAIAEALGRKDEVEIAERMREAGADPTVLTALAALESLDDGVRLLSKTPAAGAAERLLALHRAAVSRGFGDRLTADLGEIRSAAYYTGMLFRAYATGSPDPIASGGRYDDLLSQFGARMPAVGFAIDLDALTHATRAASASAPPRERVLVIGDEGKAQELRSRGVVAVSRPEREGAAEWAQAWGFVDGSAEGGTSQTPNGDGSAEGGTSQTPNGDTGSKA